MIRLCVDLLYHSDHCTVLGTFNVGLQYSGHSLTYTLNCVFSVILSPVMLTIEINHHVTMQYRLYHKLATQSKNMFLMVLEVRIPRSFQQDWFLMDILSRNLLPVYLPASGGYHTLVSYVSLCFHIVFCHEPPLSSFMFTHEICGRIWGPGR